MKISKGDDYSRRMNLYIPTQKVQAPRFSFPPEPIAIKKGWLYARRMNLYISRFSYGVLFSYSTINKMATDGGGGEVDGRDDFKRGYSSRVEIPTRMQIFFLLIFVYKLTSTNSYMLLRLYKFVYFLCDFCTNSYIFYKNCIVRIHTTSHGSPSTPPAPTRPHPAAPTLGYTRLPRR